MNKITLAAYSIRLKDKETREYIAFGDLMKNQDFVDFMQSFFDEFEKKTADDQENNQLFRITPKTVQKSNREFSGIIETGEYGYESEIIDKNTGKSKYKRSITDAEMLPFYFLISLPRDKDIGFLLLQRFGVFGISKIFRNNLRKFFRQTLPVISIEIEPIYSENLLQKILKYGEVKKVTFTRFDIPSDLADYYEKNKNKEVLGRLEYSLVANRNAKLNIGDRINKMLFGAGKINKLVQLTDFPYDSTKVQVKHGNETRSFIIGDLFKFRAYYDLTDKVKIGKNGHPLLDSIDKEAKIIRKELRDILYPIESGNA